MPASVVVAGVFDVAFDGLAVLDERGRYLYVNGLGLVSMRERAERVGGRLTLESVPAGGTSVRIVVPDMLLAPPPGLDDAGAGHPLS
jgi:signal transduction histidine kinase